MNLKHSLTELSGIQWKKKTSCTGRIPVAASTTKRRHPVAGKRTRRISRIGKVTFDITTLRMMINRMACTSRGHV